MKHRWQPVVMVTLAMVMALMFSGGVAQGQERIPENTLMVQGQGAVKARPDSFDLSISVITEAKTAEAARQANAQKMSAIIQRLKALNIPKLTLQTTGFRVYPIREPINPEERARRNLPGQIVGYGASNTLRVTLEEGSPDTLAEHASRVMDTATAAGASQVSGIRFYLSQNAPSHQEALTLAVAQARQMAQAIAQAAGVTLTGIFNIETYSQATPMRQSMALGSAAKAEQMDTPVEAGELDVTASVTIRFDFRD